MKMSLVFYMLYFIQIGDDNNNPMACYTCLKKLQQEGLHSHMTGKSYMQGNSGNFKNWTEEVLEMIGKAIVNIWYYITEEDRKKKPDPKPDPDDDTDTDTDSDDDDSKKKGTIYDPAIVKQINKYFSKESNGLIKKVLILTKTGLTIDELYATGLWDQAFDPAETKPRAFYHSTKKIELPTMRNVGTYSYTVSSELEASLIEMPYDDGKWSLLIVLPHSPDGIVDLMYNLQTPPLLEDAIADMDPTNVEIYLPKFEVDTMFDLEVVLLKLGIPGLKLTKNVDSKFQKVKIEINEEGKASPSKGSKVRKPVQFKVQWPFYYEIRYKKKPIFNGVYGIN